MSSEKNISVTELGNPAKPQGEAGEIMLRRMGGSHSGVTEWAFGKLDIIGNERVLDIGCGGGDALKRMSSFITSGKLTGVDHSKVSVELSRQTNIEDIKSGKTAIIEGSVEALPFPDDSFDIIYTVESFYFWGNKPENLAEILRVLTVGGTFLIAADIHGDAALSPDELKNIEKYQLFNPTLSQFREIMTAAGFKNILIHTCEGTSWVCVKAHK